MPNKMNNEMQAGAELRTERKDPEKKPMTMRMLAFAGKLLLMLASIILIGLLLSQMFMTAGTGVNTAAENVANVSILDKFDMFITNQISSALEGVLDIEKVYWLSDSDDVAPKPDPDNYGTAADPLELMWLLEEAAELIDGQEMMFSADRSVWSGDQIYYYYDETILVITWKEVIDNTVYTISEVKIAHPSQFRRFLADGEFGSDKQYITTDMAKSVNSVIASSGDFYKHRYYGIVVHEGVIKRAEFSTVDTCFIDDNSNLIFSPKKQFSSELEAQQFVDENNIRFSLAFGPILVENGAACPPDVYMLGEIDGYYSRMALCQRDELHYLLVNATAERASQKRPTIFEFADVLEGFGCEKAYALDGGQTTVIAMNGELITSVDYGYQRQISDIIYFATALPDGE